MQDLQWKYNNNNLRYVSVVGGEARPATDAIPEDTVVCNVPENTFIRRIDVLVDEIDSENRDDIIVIIGDETLTVTSGDSIATKDLNISDTKRLPVTVMCENTKGIERIMVTVDFIAFDRVNIKQIKAVEVEA